MEPFDERGGRLLALDGGLACHAPAHIHEQKHGDTRIAAHHRLRGVDLSDLVIDRRVEVSEAGNRPPGTVQHRDEYGGFVVCGGDYLVDRKRVVRVLRLRR